MRAPLAFSVWIRTPVERAMMPTANTRCRSTERAAKATIMNVRTREIVPMGSACGFWVRLVAVTNGYSLEIEPRRPAPPKSDPPHFEEVYI
jgi:hypothetical protein